MRLHARSTCQRPAQGTTLLGNCRHTSLGRSTQFHMPSPCRCSLTVGTVSTALQMRASQATTSSASNDAERSASMYDKEESIVDIDGEEAVEVGNPEAGFCASEGRYTLRWLRPVATERVAAPTNAVPIVILPGHCSVWVKAGCGPLHAGFGNCTADYEAPFGQAQDSLATNLRERGWRHVHVVPLERKEWFNVARGIFTLGFWNSSLTTQPGYSWYLDKVAATVESALKDSGACQVDLIGHSAGGWLGRAFLGDPKYMERLEAIAAENAAKAAVPANGGGASARSIGGAVSTESAEGITVNLNSTLSMDTDVTLPLPKASRASAAGATVLVGSRPNSVVRQMVTLGTPQRPPPPEKMKDMTGGAQRWVDETYPGAHFASQGVQYTCVVARTVKGWREFDEQGKPAKVKGPRAVQQYAYDSYFQVCGDGQAVEGDAVVPLRSGLLPGAQTRIVLRGVYHSMSRIGTFEEDSGVVWYGSGDVIDCWLGPLAGPGASASAAAAAAAGTGHAGASPVAANTL